MAPHVRRKRILVLVHTDLVPPETLDDYPEEIAKRVAEWREWWEKHK